VTSREALNIPGEVTWRVPSLDTPEPEMPASVAELAAYAAVQLFIERACAAQPDFVLTPANAPAVQHIVSRLDVFPWRSNWQRRG